MKFLLQSLEIFSIAILILLHTAASAQDQSLQVFYEIKAAVDGNTNVARTSKRVEFGTAMTHEFGEYQLSLLFEAAEPQHYVLTATLNSIVPSSKQLNFTILSEKFEGRISTPQEFSQSEFSIKEGVVDLSIVLRLFRPD